MKIKQVNAGLVTNFEVFTQLNTRRGTEEMGPEIKIFKSNVIKYLEASAAGQETAEGVKECLKHLESIRITGRLTKAEKMQIINLVPATEVEMHLVIEECPERLDPEETQDLTINVTRILFPNAVQEEPMQDEGEGEEGNNGIENNTNNNNIGNGVEGEGEGEEGEGEEGGEGEGGEEEEDEFHPE